MVVVIKKDTTASAIKEAEKVGKEDKGTRKGFDAKKYAGKLKRGLDGLTYQKKVRDEW